MNAILLKESDLEINAYLNSLSLHQSFEEDDTEDDEFLTVNPSGSVLQPATNPYNKQKKIAEANETLFSEEIQPKSPQRVKFNRVEKRICYDYFGSSFESDSIKSCEDDESEKESLLQNSSKNKAENSLELKGNHILPHNPANKVIVTPKQEEQEHSESESEDVCVGTIKKTEDQTTITSKHMKQNEDQCEENDNVLEENNSEINKEKNIKTNTNEVSPTKEVKNANEINITESLKNLEKDKVIVKQISELNDAKINSVKHSQSNSSSLNNSKDLFPCLVNHSGITIRITGADSIESIESESSDNEVQIFENDGSFCDILGFKQENTLSSSKVRIHSAKRKDTTFTAQNQTFILRGTKTSPNIRSPKQSRKFDHGQLQKGCSNKGGSENMLNTTKHNVTKEKTETSTQIKLDKSPSTVKMNSKNMSLKSKEEENRVDSKTNECVTNLRKSRPKSCVEKESVKVKTNSRPMTAPVKRSCCQWGHPHLPEYNGLRSEYGLSAEQLMERKRHKMESLKLQKQRREQKFKEEQQKRKENEEMFIAWLENKRKQAHMKFLRNQQLQAESGIKIYPAPTAHLKRTGAVRTRKTFKSQRKCVSLEELLNNASAHEKKTYRIYLGLSFD